MKKKIHDYSKIAEAQRMIYDLYTSMGLEEDTIADYRATLGEILDVVRDYLGGDNIVEIEDEDSGEP